MPQPLELLKDSLSNIAGTIEEATPYRCFGCFRPPLISKNLATRVVEGTLTLDEAQGQFIDNLGANCLRGMVSIEPGYPRGDLECSYDPVNSTPDLTPITTIQ